ncbi:MAG: hypothetical protein ABSA41_12580 [Terriglobia bacterium]|jgi:preprotein translocase subunit SecD
MDPIEVGSLKGFAVLFALSVLAGILYALVQHFILAPVSTATGVPTS